MEEREGKFHKNRASDCLYRFFCPGGRFGDDGGNGRKCRGFEFQCPFGGEAVRRGDCGIRHHGHSGGQRFHDASVNGLLPSDFGSDYGVYQSGFGF